MFMRYELPPDFRRLHPLHTPALQIALRRCNKVPTSRLPADPDPEMHGMQTYNGTTKSTSKTTTQQRLTPVLPSAELVGPLGVRPAASPVGLLVLGEAPVQAGVRAGDRRRARARGGLSKRNTREANIRRFGTRHGGTNKRNVRRGRARAPRRSSSQNTNSLVAVVKVLGGEAHPHRLLPTRLRGRTVAATSVVLPPVVVPVDRRARGGPGGGGRGRGKERGRRRRGLRGGLGRGILRGIRRGILRGRVVPVAVPSVVVPSVVVPTGRLRRGILRGIVRGLVAVAVPRDLPAGLARGVHRGIKRGIHRGEERGSPGGLLAAVSVAVPPVAVAVVVVPRVVVPPPPVRRPAAVVDPRGGRGGDVGPAVRSETSSRQSGEPPREWSCEKTGMTRTSTDGRRRETHGGYVA